MLIQQDNGEQCNTQGIALLLKIQI
jgi:hypothetical protein